MTDVDVAVVGGGMVGASFALALAGTGVRVLLIESVAPDSDAQPSFDERTSALGNATRRIFQGLGVWDAIAREAAPIRNIHISDAGRFGFARLRAEEQGIEAFGYAVANRAIGAALWSRLREVGGVELRVPAATESVEITSEAVHLTISGDAGIREHVTARLVVAADGAHSSVRQVAGIVAEVEDYDQVAVVANVATDQSAGDTAFERFTSAGPLALLPLRDGRFTVIWTMRPDAATRALALDETTFLQELQQRFGWRAGRFVRVGRRVSYPLKLMRAAEMVGPRTALIGNAAQTLHPVAAQGFNLGLRDAAMLAEIIAASDGDVGAPELLQRFSQWRAADRQGVIRFADGLVRLFVDSRRPVTLLRDLGLFLFDVTPPAKRALARVSLGFAGPSPRLARGLPVR